LCLWFPRWPIQCLLASRSELDRAFVLLTEKTGRGEFVDCCNQPASRRGVAAGMPVAEARSLARSGETVVVEPIRPDADRLALVELALCFERYSPAIGVEEADRPQCLLMDITGIAHFFGGETPMAKRLGQELSERRFAVRAGVGDTVGAAWLAAHFFARPARPSVIPAGQLDQLCAAPVEGLRIGEAIVQKLHRLGIAMTGQVLGLDRSSLVSRFGGEVNLRLDQLTGHLEELIVPCRAVPKFQVEQFLEYGVKRPETVEQWWTFLLTRLVGPLQARQLGTRHVRCRLITERKTAYDFAIRLCQPAADARQIGDLLRLQLEGLRFDAPLVGMRMEALETSPLERPQEELFTTRPRDHVRRLSCLLNRLCNRLGEQAVVRPRLLPDAVPERAVALVPAVDGGLSRFSCERKWDCPLPASGVSFLPLDRPACLLPRPRAVKAISIVPDGPPCALFYDGMRLEVARLWGPERIEAGWWQDLGDCPDLHINENGTLPFGTAVRRDYYRIETAEGRRFWVFRRLDDQQWFLHGESF
jgi:protein ImuB